MKPGVVAPSGAGRGLADAGRDDDVIDAGDRAGVVDAVDRAQRAGHAGRGRDHHHPGRATLARRDVVVPSACRTTTSSSVRPSAKRRLRAHSPPIGRAASSMSTGWPGSSAARRARGRSRGRAPARPLSPRRRCVLVVRGQPRRRDVKRLLERRTVQRIGLVEQRHHLQVPARQDAFDGELGPGDERLDQDLFGGRGIGSAHRRIGEQARQPRERRRQRRRSSARMTPRLPDNMSGLTTHGNPIPPRAAIASATRPGSAPRAVVMKRGCETSASADAASRWRIAVCSPRRPSPPGRLPTGPAGAPPPRPPWPAARPRRAAPPDRRRRVVGGRDRRRGRVGIAKSMTSESAGQCHARSST